MPSSHAADLRAIVESLALVVTACLAHWGLRRLARRLPLFLARRSSAGRAPTPGAGLPWQRTTAITVLGIDAGLWAAVAMLVSERFALLGAWRRAAAMLLSMSFTAPLFHLNQKSYSTLDVIALPLVFGALWLVARALTHVVRSQVLRSTGIERGVQESLAVLAHYTFMLLGSIVALQAWGIDLSSLTIVASVLGVGIGFGLQNIANNFVSGLLISFERPIKLGDFVNVGAFAGTVEKIGARSTEIRTLDRVTILIPNSRLLESEVINWSHGDPVSRVHVPVGVGYGADVAQVHRALLEAAHAHPTVLADPRPRVSFKGFGDSALDFELLVWTREPQLQNALTSDLNHLVLAALRRHGIEIPYPQRDLHLRSAHLDTLLAAWGKSRFPDAELGPLRAPGAAPQATAPLAQEEPRLELGPRQWSDGELEALVTRMRSAEGIPIQDRRHLLTVYPRCFVGHEAVDWLQRFEGLTGSEAVALGQSLIDRGIVHHVLDEHGFRNGNFFYRFYADEDAADVVAGRTRRETGAEQAAASA